MPFTTHIIHTSDHGKVISVQVRSSLPSVSSSALKSDSIAGDDSTCKEMDYLTMLNRKLPESIRVIACSPVTTDFNSRFSASSRTYRYFFVVGSLNIPAMALAASYLVGNHDFRNLCKMDLANVSNFRRDVYRAEILKFVENKDKPCASVWMLEIEGIAFLWHMIRCIMAVLFMVGANDEKPEIVLELLDVEACPTKPAYTMACEMPLVLQNCHFENLRLKSSSRVLWALTAHFQAMWEKHQISAARALNCLQHILSHNVPTKDFDSFAMHLSNKKALDKTLSGNTTESKQRGKPTQSTNGDSIISSAEESIADHCVENKAKRMKVEQKSADGYSTSAPEVVNELINWGHALEIFLERYGAVPSSSNVPHIPLMQVWLLLLSRNSFRSTYFIYYCYHRHHLRLFVKEVPRRYI